MVSITKLAISVYAVFLLNVASPRYRPHANIRGFIAMSVHANIAAKEDVGVILVLCAFLIVDLRPNPTFECKRFSFPR